MREKKTENGIKKPFYKRGWFIGIVVVFVLFSIFGDNDKDTAKEANKTKDTPVKEDVVKDKEKDKKKDTKETLASLYPQGILEKSQFKANIQVGAKYFIEEYEKQKVKKITNDTVAVYSSEPVHDQSGAEFPYSFLVSGRYEEKGTGALKDFIMTLGYKDEKSLEEGLASCIQYINEDTGYELNVMDPDDDIILKMLETLNNGE